MLAFLFCLALFLFWWTVGYALVRSLHASRSIVQDILIAPVVGLVATVLPVWTISRLGLPVGKFGWAIAVVFFPTALFILWRLKKRGPSDPRYPIFPWRAVWPFLLVLGLGLAAQARPMFSFGFDWVSYCNDDMANYCLASERFYHHGFFDFPEPNNLLRGENYSEAFYFMYVMIRQRPGCELILAWAMSVSGLNAHEVFMPVIMAMFMGLVTASCALVMFPSEQKRKNAPANSPLAEGEPNYVPALLTGVMVSLSALTTLGVMYQLIAQVVGLSMIGAIAVLILRPFIDLSKSNLIRHGVLLAIMGGGLLITYPEVTPFLGLSFFVYTAIAIVKRRTKLVPTLAVLGIAVVGVFALLRIYAAHALGFLFLQAQATNGDVTVLGVQRTLFPYYMVPKGLADLWGFQRIGNWQVWHWWIDISIVAGAILTIFTIIAAIRYTLRNRPEATITFVMFGLGLVLFKNRSGFGLFKLAMFVQPFALGLLVIAWSGAVEWIAIRLRSRKRRPIAKADRAEWRPGVLTYAFQVVPLLLVASGGLWSQAAYVQSSYGIGTAFLEISDASRTKLNDEIVQIIKTNEPKQVISDTFNMVLAKFISLYTPGRELAFPANRYFDNIESIWQFDLYKHRLSPEHRAQAEKYVEARNELMVLEKFDIKDPKDPKARNLFRVTDQQLDPVLSHADRKTGEPRTPTPMNGPGGKEPLVMVAVGRQSVFNRFHFDADLPENFVAMPLTKARDILVYVSSDLGPPYYFTGNDKQPTIYQMENEPKDSPFFPGATMCGAGRYMLAEVINPSPKVRLTMSLTLSYHSDGENQVPPNMAAIGKERVPFPVVGRGSARVFSAPFEPQWVKGRPYIMSDLGSGGRKFPEPRLGLMKWFGRDVPIDRRVLSAFARDISIVSEEDYANLRPPSWIGGFVPTKENPLRNEQIEYSGFYEDGWVAEDAFIRLLQPTDSSDVVIRGQVPLVANNANYRANVILSVDGIEVAKAELPPGDFILRGPAPATTDSTATTQPSGMPKPPTTQRTAKNSGTVRTIRLQFIGPIQRLPDPDSRPAAASLKSIGFQQGSTVAQK